MSGVPNKSLTTLLSEDLAYPGWLKRITLTPPAWRTSLHEAGHVAAAIKLCGAQEVRAYIFGPHDGVTLAPKATGLAHLILVAAGEAAGAALARRFPPPAGGPVFYECQAALDAAEEAPRDEQRLSAQAKGCLPSRKSIRRMANRFVRAHTTEILSIATSLYAHGSREFSIRGHSDFCDLASEPCEAR